MTVRELIMYLSMLPDEQKDCKVVYLDDAWHAVVNDVIYRKDTNDILLKGK